MTLYNVHWRDGTLPFFCFIKCCQMPLRFFQFCHFEIPLSTFNLSRYCPRVKKYELNKMLEDLQRASQQLFHL